jgi:RNA polymerase sigma factor (sigma-70 family)
LKTKDIEYVRFIINRIIALCPSFEEFRNDMEQEGMLAHIKATEDYDATRGSMDRDLFILYKVKWSALKYVQRREMPHFKGTEVDHESPYWDLEPVSLETVDDRPKAREELRDTLSGIDFTPRQNDVLKLYLQDKTLREIAVELGISLVRTKQLVDIIVHKARKFNGLS